MEYQMNRSPVAIVRAQKYDSDLIQDSVRHAFDLIGGTEPLRKKGKKLLLKPNILNGSNPSKAVTTHPVFFEAVVLYLKSQGFTLFTGDSPGLDSSENAAKKAGIWEIAKKHGVTWADFNDSVDIPNPDGLLVKNFTVARIFQQIDAVVSLPKLKTHSQMYYTGAIKNIYGMIPGLRKARLHVRFPEREQFARMITDLNVLIKPSLAIMDAITAMEGPGPNNGTPIDIGLILASYDPLALDTAACKIVGYDPEQIPILADAYTRKIWISSPAMLETKGERIESVMAPNFKKVSILKRTSFLKSGPVSKFLRNVLVPQPVFSKKRCILCRKCVDICQAYALSIKESQGKKSVDINRSRCIRCYCCHEICPADAIDHPLFTQHFEHRKEIRPHEQTGHGNPEWIDELTGGHLLSDSQLTQHVFGTSCCKDFQS